MESGRPISQERVSAFLRAFLIVVLLLFIMAGLLVTCLPPGSLPMRLQALPQALWIVLTSIGWGCFCLIVAFTGPRRFWWHRALSLLLLATLVTTMIVLSAPKVTAKRLCKHRSVTPSAYVMSSSHPKAGPLRLFLSWLKDQGVPIHPVIQDWVERSPDDRDTSLESTLLGSRWSTRKAFVAAMLDDPIRQRMLVMRWSELFHAVVNQDVDLSHRRELLEMLERVRTSVDSSPDARRAASFWMGLIFLTDPPEFMADRVRIRDAILGEADPPYDIRSDAWMRLADCLLTYDDPSDWSRLTANYASNPTLLRRATRERLRGMASHHEAIAAEVMAAEIRGDFQAALSQWLDAGRLAGAHPSAQGARELGEWCGARLVDWASATELEGVLKAYAEFAGRYDVSVAQSGFAVDPEMQERFAQAASRWSRRALDSNGGEVGRNLDVVGLFWPLLAESRRATLAMELAPVLLRDPGYLANDRQQNTSMGVRVNIARVYWMSAIWKYLNAEQHAQHRQQLHQLWQNGYVTGHGMGRLLWMDAWSPQPSLSQEEWLFFAWLLNDEMTVPLFQRVDHDAPHDPVRYRPLPVPEVEPSVVLSLLDKMVEALGKTTQEHRVGDVVERIMSQIDGGHFGKGMSYQLAKTLRRLENEEWIKSRTPGHELRQILFESLVACGAIDFRRPEYAGLVQEHGDHRCYSSSPQRVWAMVRACPDWWGRDMIHPASARSTLSSAIHDSSCFGLLLAGCESQPEGSLAIGDIWDVLISHASSHNEEEVRLRAFAGLFRLYPRFSASQRIALREEFRKFYATRRLSVAQWPLSELSFRPELKGEGISWEDDALAAEWAWSSGVKSEVDLYPGWLMAARSSGVFSYLAQACICLDYDDYYMGGHMLESPLSTYFWQRQPLVQPFEPTPWQRARQLHLRRPDLHFPDHFPIRPKMVSEN